MMKKHSSRLGLNLFCTIIALGVLISIFPAGGPWVHAQEDVGDDTFTQEDRDALNNNWPQWDTFNPYSIACTDQGTRDSALVGNDNIERAFNYFISSRRGLSAPQSAGILGNLMQESHVNPTVHQTGKDGKPMASGKLPVNGVGFGIAQWTFTSRQAPLVALAQSRSVDANTLAVQLDYMWQELGGTHKQALEELKKQTTAADAARSFHKYYEGSADDARAIQERVVDAESVLAKYGATAGGAQPDLATTTCGGSNILVGEYSFPLAPRTKRNYGYTLPCKNPKMNSPYTKNGVYTDRYGKSTVIRACHHDATPAFDLSYGAAETGNQPIYAFTTGTVVRVNRFYKEDEAKSSKYDNLPCNSIDFKADIATDKSYYWYGHVLADAEVGKRIGAGTPIGKVAPSNYGPVCWQGGVHVHFDRGCIQGGRPEDYLVTGVQQHGGGKTCRDPGLLNDLVKIWEALPAQ